MPDTNSNARNEKSEHEATWEEEEAAIVKVDHKAEITVLEVLKDTMNGDLTYTILIKDKANLEKPVAVDLPLTPVEGGRLLATIVTPLELEANYGIKVE